VIKEVGLCRCVGIVVFDFLRNDKTIVFVKGNEVAVERDIVGCGEAQAVFGIEAVLLVFSPRADVAGAKDVRKRETVPHEAADNRLRVVFRQNGTEHVERADVGRGLAAPVRVRGEDEVSERLPKRHLPSSFFWFVRSLKLASLFWFYIFSWRFSSLDYMALTFLPGHKVLYHKPGGKSSMKKDIFSRRGTSGDTPRRDCIKW